MKNNIRHILTLALCFVTAIAIADNGNKHDSQGNHDRGSDDRCSPVKVVTDFMAQSNSGSVAQWLSFFADSPTTCFSNTGLKNPRGEVGGCYLGLAEIGSFLSALLPLFDNNEFIPLNITHNGNTVMVRRIDNVTVGAAAATVFPTANVGASFEVQVMSYFRVENCKITQWSDYSNLADFSKPSGIPLP